MPQKNIFKKFLKTPISRRDFLQKSAIASTLALLQNITGSGLQILEAATKEVKKSAQKAGEWIYTCCNMCGGQSGIKVKVIDGMVRQIEPNDYNPNNIANISTDFKIEKNRGARICPKGNAAIKSLYDPDRLKSPMIKVGERGSGKWKPISWEEAVEITAKRLSEIKAKYGAQSLVWFSEDHSFTHPQVDFCDLFGTPNYSNHSNLCDVSRKAGFKLVMGVERPLADFQNAKYALLFGWNPLGAMKFSHLPAVINRGREKGMKLVVVDPVFSQTAAKADEWISLRPGTDGALALAIGHVIIREKLFDQTFIDEWTTGFDKYKEFLKDKTPSWAAEVTSVPASTIERIARELAANKPCVIDVWSGPGHHTNATQGARAIALIAALLGQYDKPGTMITPDKKGGNHRKLDFDKPKEPRVDGGTKKYPFSHKSGIYCESRDAMITGKPYPPKAAVFVFQNFVMAVPNTKKNVQAIKNMDFVLVIDTHMSETAKLADLVVPGSHFLERYDLNSHWVTFPCLGLRQPAVKSWINGWPEYKFVFELGKKLGLKDKKGIGFDLSYEDFLSQELKEGIKISLDELKKLPGAVWIGGETTYEKYKKTIKLGETDYQDFANGLARDKDGKAIGIMKEDKVYQGFETPSRKIEFYSEQMLKKGVDPLPVYTPPDDAPTKEYPLYLIGWKQAEHTHTRTFNNTWLMEMKPTNPLWMNKATGKNLGLKEGDKIIIESTVAKAQGTVHLTEGIHPEVVGLHHGYGHWAFGKIAKGKGTADGQFFPGKAEKISGQAITKEIGVRVYKT